MFKQSSLKNLSAITLILFECHRSMAKSIDVYFFLFVNRNEFIITKSPVVEIQNLVMNPKS